MPGDRRSTMRPDDGFAHTMSHHLSIMQRLTDLPPGGFDPGDRRREDPLKKDQACTAAARLPASLQSVTR